MTEIPDLATPVPPPEPVMEALQVKRYANRKIYVPEQRRYANFTSLYETILTGRDIVVRCAATKRDVTTQVLGMIYQEMCINAGRVSEEELVSSIRSHAAGATQTDS